MLNFSDWIQFICEIILDNPLFLPVKEVQIWKICDSGFQIPKSEKIRFLGPRIKIPESEKYRFPGKNPLIWKTSVNGINIQKSESLNSEIRNETKTFWFSGKSGDISKIPEFYDFRDFEVSWIPVLNFEIFGICSFVISNLDSDPGNCPYFRRSFLAH